jgi:nucleotide-binding universal stress UspA family protein
MKKVIACIDGSPASAAVCDAGAWAACTLRGQLSFAVPSDACSGLLDNSGLAIDLANPRGDGLPFDPGAAEDRQARLLSAYATVLLEAAQVRVGPRAQVARDPAPSVQSVARIARRARDAQLVVMPQDMVMSGGALYAALSCPVLAVPARTPTAWQGVVVAFDGRISGRRMIDRLADFPLLRGRPVHVVMAAASTETTRLELAWAVERIRTACPVESADLLPGQPADAIRAFVAQRGSQLLVLGGYHHATCLPGRIGHTMNALLQLPDAAALVLR